MSLFRRLSEPRVPGTPIGGLRCKNEIVHRVDERNMGDATNQYWATPPSTISSTPVTYALSSEARNTAVPAISSGVPMRSSGPAASDRGERPVRRGRQHDADRVAGPHLAAGQHDRHDTGLAHEI